MRWCFKLKDGIKIIKPNDNLSKQYMVEAHASIKRATRNFEDRDLLWTTVVLYYAEYYSLYSFLQKIGIKCENHTCSILIAEFLIGDCVKVIKNHRSRRIDAQYYMRIEQRPKISHMLQEAIGFIALFDNLISNLSNDDIAHYRKRIKSYS